MPLVLLRRVRSPLQSLVTIALCALIASSARAGSTDPTLAIGQVTADAASEGALVVVTGTWQFDDILQIDFPLTAVITQGASFIRYPAGAEPQSGILAALADGLQPGDIAALEAAGVSEPDGELVTLGPSRIVLALPPSVGDGELTTVLYISLPGEGIVISNAVTTTLVGTGGGP